MCAQEDDHDDDEEPPLKKAKAGGAAEEKPNKGKATCTTKSGGEAPKNIKKDQEKMNMTTSEFLTTANALEIDVDGNLLRGEPRTFSSGACGWYLGGKIEMDVGGQRLWAQIGANVVIPGSNVWEP